MTLSVKYFEEMKKQVNILERDETQQVNFSVHCECLVWIYDPFVSLQTLKNSPRVRLPPLSSFLPLSLCIVTVEIISQHLFCAFALSFNTGLHPRLTSRHESCAHAHAHTSQF